LVLRESVGCGGVESWKVESRLYCM